MVTAGLSTQQTPTSIRLRLERDCCLATGLCSTGTPMPTAPPLVASHPVEGRAAAGRVEERPPRQNSVIPERPGLRRSSSAVLRTYGPAAMGPGCIGANFHPHGAVGSLLVGEGGACARASPPRSASWKPQRNRASCSEQAARTSGCAIWRGIRPLRTVGEPTSCLRKRRNVYALRARGAARPWRAAVAATRRSSAVPSSARGA